MKIFEEATREKAKDEYRLLLVDGHNSHYTVAFLLLARLNKIIVLCYPAHGTHIYQGLDVVIFAIFKLLLGQERDKLLRDTGKAINKSNFLSVISNAYTRALTPGNIRTAFRKTGVHPFNPNVITSDMLAPSKETSLESHLPVETSESTKIFADMLRKLRAAEEVQSDPSDSNHENLGPSDSTTPDQTDSEASEKETAEASTSTPTSTTRRTCVPNLKRIDILEETVAALKKTNLAYLAAHTPTTSSDTMPKTATRTRAQVAGPVNTTAAALTIEPSTSNELLLLAALRESESRNIRTEIHAFELQASNILNEAYTERLRKALETKEEKKNKGKGTKLVGDGLPKLLTGDAFYELAKEKEKEVREIEKQKEARKGGRAAYRTAIEEWNEAEQARKDEITTIKASLDKAVTAWTKKKAAAAKKGNKFIEKKPKRDAFPPKTPKPKLKDFVGGSNFRVESGDEAGDDADEDRSDSSASDNENDDNS
jgi:hypothetical protein